MIRLVPPSGLKKLVEHPCIRPHLGPGDVTDLSWVYDDGGIALSVDGTPGAMVFCLVDKGIYEAHLLFPPETRGGPAFEAAKAIIGWLFTIPDVRAIHGFISRDNRVALAFAAKLGSVPLGTVETDVGLFRVHTVLSREQWASYWADQSQRAAAQTAPSI